MKMKKQIWNISLFYMLICTLLTANLIASSNDDDSPPNPCEELGPYEGTPGSWYCSGGLKNAGQLEFSSVLLSFNKTVPVPGVTGVVIESGEKKRDIPLTYDCPTDQPSSKTESGGSVTYSDTYQWVPSSPSSHDTSKENSKSYTKQILVTPSDSDCGTPKWQDVGVYQVSVKPNCSDKIEHVIPFDTSTSININLDQIKPWAKAADVVLSKIPFISTAETTVAASIGGTLDYICCEGKENEFIDPVQRKKAAGSIAASTEIKVKNLPLPDFWIESYNDKIVTWAIHAFVQVEPIKFAVSPTVSASLDYEESECKECTTFTIDASAKAFAGTNIKALMEASIFESGNPFQFKVDVHAEVTGGISSGFKLAGAKFSSCEENKTPTACFEDVVLGGSIKFIYKSYSLSGNVSTTLLKGTCDKK